MSKSNIEKIVTVCNNCRSSNAELVAQGRDREYADTTDDIFSFVLCRECGLHYLSPRPADSELGTIYPRSYHSYRLRGEAKGQKGIGTRVRQWVYGLRLRKTMRGLEWKRELSLLDVGCGDGWMLDCFRAISRHRVQTTGVDISPEACAAAASRGHRTFCGRFEELDFGGEKFDLINMSHVIEHVGDPTAFLTRARRLLAPGGRVIIETPNVQSMDGKLFRRGTWGAYHFPRHWFLYDPRTLRALAGNVGLALSRLDFHACPVHWHWSFHNWLLEKGSALARVFRPQIIFEGGLRTLAYLSVFTAVDQLIKLAGLPTSNMMAILTEPGEESVLRTRNQS